MSSPGLRQICFCDSKRDTQTHQLSLRVPHPCLSSIVVCLTVLLTLLFLLSSLLVSPLSHLSLSAIRRSLESPYNTALLLSLRGVQSLILNQYHIAPSSLAANFTNFWKQVQSGAKIGQAMPGLEKTAPAADAILSPRSPRAARPSGQSALGKVGTKLYLDS